MRARSIFAWVALALAASAGQMAAQVEASTPAPFEKEVWFGLARGSPEWGVLGKTPGMNLALLAVRVSTPLGGPVPANASRETTYHLDIIPLAVISPPYVSLSGDDAGDCSPGALCVAPADRGPGLFPDGSVWGVGFAPIGVTTRFRRNSRVSPSLGVTGGALLFYRAAPTTRSGQFNFTASVEAGLRIGRPNAGVLLIYRLHHISNAGTAKENPGVASHLFTVGFALGRRE